MRSATLKTILLLASVTMTILGAEGFMVWLDLYRPVKRFYVDDRQSQYNPNFIADTATGWRMRPNHSFSWRRGSPTEYRAGSNGFRIGRTEIPVSYRHSIAILGDSFIWGTGVAFGQTVGQVVATSVDSTIVRNYAMPGFGVDQIYRSLQRQVLPTDPDLVVIGLFTDDFNRSFTAYRWVEKFTKPVFHAIQGKPVESTATDNPGPMYRWVESSSRLFAFLRHVDRWAGLNFGWGDWWSLNESLIDAMRIACSEAEVPVLFVHIPYKIGTPFPALESYMSRNEVQYIDLNAITTREQRRELYFRDDGHLNSTGHAFLGRRITRWAEQLHLNVPSDSLSH